MESFPPDSDTICFALLSKTPSFFDYSKKEPADIPQAPGDMIELSDFFINGCQLALEKRNTLTGMPRLLQ